VRRFPFLRVAAAVAVGILAAGLATAPSFAATVLWSRLETGVGGNNAEGLYLTVAGYSTANGANAQVADYDNRTTGSQFWQWFRVPGGEWALRNAGTTDWKALSIKGNAAGNGVQVVQWQYEQSNRYEQWTQATSGGITRYKNVGTGYCLAVAGGGNGRVPSGANVITWNCTGGSDQDWTWQ